MRLSERGYVKTAMIVILVVVIIALLWIMWTIETDRNPCDDTYNNRSTNYIRPYMDDSSGTLVYRLIWYDQISKTVIDSPENWYLSKLGVEQKIDSLYQAGSINKHQRDCGLTQLDQL